MVRIDNHKKDLAYIADVNKMLVSAPRCPDGNWVVYEKGDPYSNINIVERNNGPHSYNGSIFFYMGNMVDGHLNFHDYPRRPGQPCLSEKKCLEYIEQCKDENNRNIFDIFKGPAGSIIHE
jgi:hypothetical protein